MTSRQNNYGIHILKFLAIFFQIEVHAYVWLNFANAPTISTPPLLWQAKLLLLKGSLSMLVPITAAAILRMSLPLKETVPRLPSNFNSRPYFMVILGLAVIESIKDALLYGWGALWNWNVLHLIALTFFLILLLADKPVKILWLIALANFALTPLVLFLLKPIEMLPFAIRFSPPYYNYTPWIYFTLLTSILGYLGYRYTKSKKISRRHKKRGLVVLALVWGLCTFICTRIPFYSNDTLSLISLPMGILAGDMTSHHIWGFFPWGGLVIFGFLIYDLVLRFKASFISQALMFLTGLSLLAIFFLFLSDRAIENCSVLSKMPGFNPLCFNRTPEQVFMILGTFLMIIPLCIGLERIGFENRMVRAVSRSVFWIYLFETSFLAWLAPFWVHLVPAEYLVSSFTFFSLGTSLLLALILDHFRFDLTVTLKKNDL